MTMYKFPKTLRLDGTAKIPLSSNVHIEEKVDGNNCSIFFNLGKINLCSRNYILCGDKKEILFDWFKTWGYENESKLKSTLSNNLILYVENLYYKHKVFYDTLPHYLIGLDVRTKDGEFLNRKEVYDIFSELSIPAPPLLYEGRYQKLSNIDGLIGKSAFKSQNWRDKYLSKSGGIWDGTDNSDLMEGVYFRCESENIRLKIIRPEFKKVKDLETNFLNKKLIRNGLKL